jgi:hypothetical protein
MLLLEILYKKEITLIATTTQQSLPNNTLTEETITAEIIISLKVVVMATAAEAMRRSHRKREEYKREASIDASLFGYFTELTYSFRDCINLIENN